MLIFIVREMVGSLPVRVISPAVLVFEIGIRACEALGSSAQEECVSLCVGAMVIAEAYVECQPLVAESVSLVVSSCSSV